ncbi:MAG: molybdenum hydroxylase, partial [Candidatus Adiutrix sp.]|nr:molybdenum hydroxylase [Candidatus Adiutrix sp.]
MTKRDFRAASPLLIIKGAGDLATGTAHRLYRAGYRFIMTELARPTAIRRTVSFSQAIYDGRMTVEAVTAVRADTENFREALTAGHIPVLVAPEEAWLDELGAAALIEATLSKKNTGVTRRPGRTTLALGPGYRAGTDVDGVVET